MICNALRQSKLSLRILFDPGKNVP
ncbi:MAG: hypothetical protein RLZZ536_1240, partial [Planctomycetota bacterium]